MVLSSCWCSFTLCWIHTNHLPCPDLQCRTQQALTAWAAASVILINLACAQIPQTGMSLLLLLPKKKKKTKKNHHFPCPLNHKMDLLPCSCSQICSCDLSFLVLSQDFLCPFSQELRLIDRKRINMEEKGLKVMLAVFVLFPLSLCSRLWGHY